MDFLALALIIFRWVYMAEAVRVKINWKSAFCKGWVSICQIFAQNGTSLPIIYTRIN